MRQDATKNFSKATNNTNNTNNKRNGRPTLMRQDATKNFSKATNNTDFSHKKNYPKLINVNKIEPIEPKKHTVKYWNKYYSFINSTSRDALRQMGNNGIESQILLNNNKIDNGEKITSSEYELLKKK